ncbi:hypothetical protein C9374_003934 [Naegleria lovaniensis]|uniref:Uncharacterized protein n=1 Tax=Naegleria lovaniensis TaxID=51637 RepID=A0AA88H3X9_NAELO|nr:uncharacterized protein C9374_003934 [Naegleria lovaniensis]KAG2394170.1 hypothetical protein C9374_003934 [Naegleria lovaniensis]
MSSFSATPSQPYPMKSSLSSRRNSRVVFSGPPSFSDHTASNDFSYFISPTTVHHQHHHGFSYKISTPQQQQSSFTTPHGIINHLSRDTIQENTFADKQNKNSDHAPTPNAEEESITFMNSNTIISEDQQCFLENNAPSKPLSEKRFSKTSNSINSMKKYVISRGEIMNYTSPRGAPLAKRKHNIMTEFHPLPSTLALVPITNTTTFFMKLHCSFCGGKNCKYEDYLKTPPNESQLKELQKTSLSNLLGTPRRRRKYWAIEGLNSHYVLDNIIASQRPSSRLVQKHHIVDQFKKQNIVAVVNLQERGEHPYCGDGILEKTGFSYDPEEDFMKNKISYYNFAFPDMSIPNFDEMLAIVKAMKMDGEKGKVLVHCHAGLGRTGLVICCYLVYTKHFFSSRKAIEFVRSKRPGSIQTKSQVKFVYDFLAFLMENRTVFVCKSLKSVMDKQRIIACGSEYLLLQRVPKLVHETCSKMSHIIFATQDLSQFLVNFFTFNPDSLFQKIEAFKESLNHDDWTSLRKCNSFPTLVYLLLDWFEVFSEPIIFTKDLNPSCADELGPLLLAKNRFVEVEIINTLVRTFSQLYRRLTHHSLVDSLMLLIFSKMCKVSLDCKDPIFMSFQKQMKKGTTIKV